MAEKLSPEQKEQKYSIGPYRVDNYVRAGNLELFFPRNNKPSMLLGGNLDSSVAVVTGWSDPQFMEQEVIDQVALVSSMRTPAGVSLTLANLARNPQIRTLVRQADAGTDKTERGQVPVDLMNALFKKEYDENNQLKKTIDDNGVVIETGLQLRKELVEGGNLDVIRNVVANVELVDFDQRPKEEQIAELNNKPKQEPYFPLPVNITEFEVIDVETKPSERFGMMVRGKNAYDVWLGMLNNVMSFGQEAVIEVKDGVPITVKELPFAMAVIEGKNPFANMPDWARDKVNFELKLTEESLESYYLDAYDPNKYLDEVFPGVKVFKRPEKIKYKYNEEMHAFQRPDGHMLFMNVAEVGGLEVAKLAMEKSVELNEEQQAKVAEIMATELSDEQKANILAHVYMPAVNQYQIMIDRLKDPNRTDEADKVIDFWNPVIHGQKTSGRPCLSRMGVLARDVEVDGVKSKELNALVEFRSHDTKAWIENMYGVYRTLEDVSEKTGLGIGRIIAVSDSLHVYENDKNWLIKLWSEHFCDTELQTVFDDTNADPRGSIAVAVDGKEISMSLNNPETNEPIAQFKARTAREIFAQMAKFGWTSQDAHAYYVASEVQTAIMARDLGVADSYEQDKPEKTRRDIRRKIKK